jgi:nucleotide-binding universal stress UspA family protein
MTTPITSPETMPEAAPQTAPQSAPQTSSVGRIVVGVDGSAPSLDALRWADRVGSALGLEIDVVICWSYPTSYGMGGAFTEYRPDVEAKAAVDQALVSAFGENPPAGLRSFVREGYPANELIEASRGSEMLVVGSRGHGGFVGLLIGSVSAYCAEHAACPVVVLHHRAADRNPG